MKYQFLIFSLVTLMTISLNAQIIYVPVDHPTIQAGINAATNGDTVLVDSGTYYENIRFMGKAITVASNFILDADTNHINNTIINGSQAQHPDSAACVMFINSEDTTSILNGFTVTGGTGVFITSPWSVNCGGGIFTYNSGAKIANNKITNNYVEGDMAGGVGIASIYDGMDSWIVIDNNIINNNSCEASGYTAFGGGIGVTTNAIIKNNIIQYNTCSNQYQTADGGGIEVDAIPGSTPTTYIINNIIQFNEISGTDYVWGAGISILNSISTISNNIVRSNSINGNDHIWGAGVCFRGSSGTLINNLIINNEASGIANSECFGGGVYIDTPPSHEVFMSNNSIINNNANTDGGGIYCISVNTESINSIIWNNSPNQIAGSFLVSYSDIMGGWQGEGNISEDPLFMGSGDYPYSLQDDSPCINSGTPDITGLNLPEFDLAGNPRLYGGRIEMGAYENQNVILTRQRELFDRSNFNLCVYPNPIIDQATIKFTLPDQRQTILSILDFTGKQVKTIVAKELPKGEHNFNLKAIGLNDGNYLIQLKTEESIQFQKMVIIK